jgi:hypothetical protein
MLCSCLLLRGRVYLAVAQKRPWYICPSHSCCIAMALLAMLLPPLGYSSRMAYRHTTIYSFLRAVLATSVLGLTFLTIVRFSEKLLSSCSCCSLLKAAHPEWLPDKVPVGPGVPPSSFFPHYDAQQEANSKDSAFSRCAQNYLKWLVLLHLWLLICMQSLFPFRRGSTNTCNYGT